MELRGGNFILREWRAEDVPSISANADNIKRYSIAIRVHSTYSKSARIANFKQPLKRN